MQARARCFAILLLAAIGSDLVGDTGCHELSEPVPEAAWQRAAPEDTADACATVCVPDCFCCTRSTAAAPAVTPPAPGSVHAVEPAASPGRRAGVHPRPDRPPLLPA